MGNPWLRWRRYSRRLLGYLRPPIRVAADLDWLSHAWERRFPDFPPIGYRIRGGDRWVRFHSLPGSKRYPESEAEYAELLRRHHAVLETLAERGSPLLAFTFSWSPTSRVRDRERSLKRVAPGGKLWRSFDVEPNDDTWMSSVFVSEVVNTPESLDGLLRLVADDGTADVILTTSDLEWLYHPYDGGADVIAESVDRRAALKRQFADWSAPYESGR
nr:hypothetical protein [Gordonia araii]